MADITDGSTASWIQAGGVLAFAGAVLVQLRDFRRELAPLLKGIGETLGFVQTTMSALLERERARAERLAAQDAARQAQANMRKQAVPESSWDGEGNTGAIEIPIEQPKKRMQTQPGVESPSYRSPARGGSDRP